METNEIVNNEKLVDKVVTAIPEVTTTSSVNGMKATGIVLLATAIVGGGIYLAKKLKDKKKDKKKVKDEDNPDENSEDYETIE